MKSNLRKKICVMLSTVMIINFFAPNCIEAKEKAKFSAKFSVSKVSIKVGSKKLIKIKNTKKKVAWSIKSGKNNILLLSKKKTSVIIKGKKVGNARIQAKVNGKKLVCKITILKKTTTTTNQKTKERTILPSATQTSNPQMNVSNLTTIAPNINSTEMPVESEIPAITPTMKPLENLTPGLYNELGEQLYSWKQMLEKKIIEVNKDNAITQYKDDEGKGCILKIDNSVKTIGKSVFKDCDTLTNVLIPDSVTNIEYGAFENCTKLASIEIPSNVTSIGACAFIKCTGLTSVILPEGLVSIQSNAFSGCNSLCNISIPNSVTSIEHWAFSSCSSLRSFTISKNVDNFGNFVLSGCTNLEKIEVEKSNRNYYSENNCIIDRNINSVIAGCKTSIIPEGISSIKEGTFYACFGLTSISIPDSVTNIEYMAFAYCANLEKIEVDGNNKNYRSENNCIIDNNLNSVIVGCKTSIIPKDITNIGAGAFWGCYTLMDVVIPDNVTSIEKNAFFSCSNLQNITIPNTVTNIEDNAFAYCLNLESIIIPSGITSIGTDVFYNCDNLSKVTIAEGVTFIGEGMFCGCNNLIELEIASSVTNIKDGAFSGCSKLSSITIPEGVTSIGSDTFANCTQLSKIKWRDTTYDSVDSFMENFQKKIS